MNISAIILAAGKGTRMKSNHPKVLHKIFDKTLLEWVCDSLSEAGIDEQIAVVGHRADEIKSYIGNRVKYALQEEQKGTGHAVMQAENLVNNLDGITLVLCGDAPLITTDTLKNTLEYHINNGCKCTIITAEIDNPEGYGRIIRDKSGNVLKNVEHKDATEEEREIKEINSGLYCFSTRELFNALKKIKNNNSQGEYYLPDTLEILIQQGHKVGAIKIPQEEIMGINSREQLAIAYNILKDKILVKHMENGVTIIDKNSTHISPDSTIGIDTVIYPGTIIEGKTVIGENCVIGPNTRISNSNIENDVNIQYSVIDKSTIKKNSNIGPFAYIK